MSAIESEVFFARFAGFPCLVSRKYLEIGPIWEFGLLEDVEWLPDSVQREHIDWGFHLTGFFGTDYRSTMNKGYFSSQLLDHDRQYGFDPVLEYSDVYFPHVAKGMNVRVGRFISIPGIEAQLTPNNYIFSHSLLYAVDPFTDTGVLATIQANDRWVVQVGFRVVMMWCCGPRMPSHRSGGV